MQEVPLIHHVLKLWEKLNKYLNICDKSELWSFISLTFTFRLPSYISVFSSTALVDVNVLHFTLGLSESLQIQPHRKLGFNMSTFLWKSKNRTMTIILRIKGKGKRYSHTPSGIILSETTLNTSFNKSLAQSQHQVVSVPEKHRLGF